MNKKTASTIFWIIVSILFIAFAFYNPEGSHTKAVREGMHYDIYEAEMILDDYPYSEGRTWTCYDISYDGDQVTFLTIEPKREIITVNSKCVNFKLKKKAK